MDAPIVACWMSTMDVGDIVVHVTCPYGCKRSHTHNIGVGTADDVGAYGLRVPPCDTPDDEREYRIVDPRFLVSRLT
jgi:hypothetical protein